MGVQHLSECLHGLVFDLLKDPEEADEEVRAVHDEAKKDETDECDLRVADIVGGLARPSTEVRVIGLDAWELVVPARRGLGRALEH